MDARENQTVIIHSWDFDGMLASKYYQMKIQELIQRAAAQNRSLTNDDYMELADHILDKYGKEFFDGRFTGQDVAARHVVYVGSDRQDRATDFSNGTFKTRGGVSATLSCYPFYEALIRRIGDRYKVDIALDKFLLEDLYQRVKPGTVFADEMNAFLKLSVPVVQAMAEVYRAKEDDVGRVSSDAFMSTKGELGKARTLPAPIRPNYIDHLKFMLLYAQMHHAMKKHAQQGEHVQFRFADDRRDILSAAHEIFSAYPHLIPPLLSLTIEQFLPPDAEYRSINEKDRREDDVNKFGEFVSQLINSNSQSISDDKVLENILEMHRRLDADLDVRITKEFMSEMILGIRKNSVQQAAIRHIANAINTRDQSAKGIIKMNEILLENSSPEEKLQKLQAVAKSRMGKIHMTGDGSGVLSVFQKKRDPEGQRLYEALVNLDINHPDIETLKSLLKRSDESPKDSPATVKKGKF